MLKHYVEKYFKKLRKAWVILVSIVLGLLLVLFLSVSFIARYLVEKYDVTYTGREVTLDWAYVNPFTGFVYFDNFVVYEPEKDTLFFTAKGVSADFALFKLFSKTYEISDLTLDHPRGVIAQNGKAFNFDDLVVRFSPDSTNPGREPTHFNILQVHVNHGEFHYREKQIPIDYFIRDLNLESTGKRWDADTIASSFSFLSQNGKGGMNGDFMIDVEKLDYRFKTNISNFDLEIIRQYLWELINFGMFSAQLNASIVAKGNFRHPDAIDLSGRLSLKDFHLGKTTKDDYAAFDELEVVILGLNPGKNVYHFDSVTLRHPFFKYEKFDSLNNLEMLFGKDAANISDVTGQAGRFNLVIEIGHYLKKLATNFFDSQFEIKALAVTDGELKYSDFSMKDKFSIEAKSLTIKADSVDKTNRRVNVEVRSKVEPYGTLSASLSINPRDSGDFDMIYHINGISAASFNPYLVNYTSFPVDRGTLDFDGVWNVRDGSIKSVNHMVVRDPHVAGKFRVSGNRRISLPWLMAVIRQRSSVIDYQIPITGNLKYPRFHFHDVLMDALKNIFTKPVTFPYGISVKNAERKIEEALILYWDVRQPLFRQPQKKFIEKMADFLKENPEASITVYCETYRTKEREHLLLFEAKKKYLMSSRSLDLKSFSTQDSARVEDFSIKDPAFMHSLKRGSGAGDTLMFTIQDKSVNFVGYGEVDKKYDQLLLARINAFTSFFIRNGTEQRVKMISTDGRIPYNGFSFFKIEYKGSIPESLREANSEMNGYNSHNPRRRYFGQVKQ